MRHLFAMAIAALALSACASDPVPVARWSKPGGTQAAFVTIRAHCIQTAKAATTVGFYVGDEPATGAANGFDEFMGDIASDFGGQSPHEEPDGDLYRRCMNGHGWSLDPKGFAAPEGDEVTLSY